MTKKRKGKISNNITPQKSIAGIEEKIIETELYKHWNITFDLSFIGCFYSIRENYFNNCLKDECDFVQQYKKCMTTLNKLSTHTINELISTQGFRHCHQICGENEKKAYKIIKKLCEKTQLDDSYFEQNIGSESIFQLGYEGSARFFGTIRGNTFRLFFIDYFHDFYDDERRNDRNLKNYKYCPMSQ